LRAHTADGTNPSVVGTGWKRRLNAGAKPRKRPRFLGEEAKAWERAASARA